MLTPEQQEYWQRLVAESAVTVNVVRYPTHHKIERAIVAVANELVELKAERDEARAELRALVEAMSRDGFHHATTAAYNHAVAEMGEWEQ